MSPRIPKLNAKPIALALLFSVALAACGGASASSGNEPGQNAGGDSEFGLPEAEIAKRVDVVEASIAACMTEAGFEYFPVDYETARIAMDSNSKPSTLTDDEYRAQFGYGITTDFSTVESQAVLGMGRRNLDVRSALSATTLLSYERALYGENSDATFVVGLDSEDLSQTGGCTRAAVEANFTADELGTNFVNYQNAEAVRVDQDPWVIAAISDWSTCMRDRGFAYSTPDDIDLDLATRLDLVTQGDDPAQLAGPAAAALADLQGEELAIAAADNECDLQFVDAAKTEVELELLGPDANQ